MSAARPKLEKEILHWVQASLLTKPHQSCIKTGLRYRWSPLFKTEPVGGPTNQPNYINAVLVVDGLQLSSIKPSEADAIHFLNKLIKLEKSYGRDRANTKRWGARSLDIDLLAWGGLQV